MRKLAIHGALLSCALAAACGGSGSGLPNGDGGGNDGRTDGSGGDVKPDVDPPKPVPGGGASGNPIDGVVNVYVLEEATDAPVKGAFVQIGETPTTARSGMTDDKGFVAIADPGLKGAQTVTAGKKTYRTSTVTDLSVSSLTLSLRPIAAPPIDTAKVRGTVDFGGLPAPPAGHYRAAYVLYQLVEPVSSPRNEILQGSSTAGVPDNSYAPGIPLLMKTEFVLVAPTGMVDLFALVVDIDPAGSFMPADWIFTPTHIGILDGLTLAKGEDRAGQKIPVVAPLDQALKVTAPAMPMGMTSVSLSVILKHGKNRLIPVYSDLFGVNFGVDPAAGVPAPKLEGSFAGGTLWAAAGTDDATGSTGPTKTGNSVQRDIASYAPAAMPPPFVPVVGSPSWAMDEIGYDPAAGAAIHTFTIAPKGKDVVWDVIVLDKARGKIHLPELPSGAPIETVPSGDLDLLGQALAIPAFDPTKTAFRDLEGIATSQSATSFRGRK